MIKPSIGDKVKAIISLGEVRESLILEIIDVGEIFAGGKIEKVDTKSENRSMSYTPRCKVGERIPLLISDLDLSGDDDIKWVY